MSDELIKPDSTNFKLSYRVYKVSSQDMNYPVTELLISDINQTRGWQSQRFCEYPQEIVIEFPCKVSLKHVQIMFHNSKIPSKIKLYSMDGADDLNYDSDKEQKQDITVPSGNIKIENERDEAKPKNDQGEVVSTSTPLNKEEIYTDEIGNDENTNIKQHLLKEEIKIENDASLNERATTANPDQSSEKTEEVSKLSESQEEAVGNQKPATIELHNQSNQKVDSNYLIGEFILKSNEDSNFTERELKSIDVDKECKYFKIKLSKCHMNKLNVFNQISILNISCFGNIMGYEDEYITGLKNINPSEAILIDRMLSKKNLFSSPTYGRMNNPYNTFIYSKNEFSFQNTDSNIEIFDDKIAALNKAKNVAVENENYIEADKLKQIMLKIEKLKSHIQKLENK